MYTLLGILESLIFLILAGLHFHWVFGGQWGFDNALPSNESGEKLFTPGPVASGTVGLGLLLCALFYLIKIDLISIALPTWILNYGGWFIGIAFILRAIGDFKYVGFFKKVKDTQFGKQDTRIYSPLCLSIGLIALLIEWI